MLRTLPWILAAATLTGGCLMSRPDQTDPQAMAERYPHKMGDQECHSWLRSHRTGFLYCASPAFEAPPAQAWTMDGVDTGPCPDSKVDLVARGQTTYDNVCAACHQANGQGTPGTYPPLAGASEFYGDAQNHAKIIVNGLQGEIQVLGQTYNNVMAPHGFLSDCDIAAVATYERNSWGNDDGIVTVDDVKAVR
jgi:mono/diheme cytochrome c family protein